MPGAAVAQIVAIDAGDHDIFELQRRDRVGEIHRLVGVERQRPAVTDVTEWATARADVAHDHERRGPLAEAFTDVRARRFLANGMQTMLAQDALDLVEARRRRRAHANPRRLAQRLGRNNFYREFGKYARRLRVALVFYAGGVGGACPVELGHHRSLTTSRATIGASSSPAACTVRSTPSVRRSV